MPIGGGKYAKDAEAICLRENAEAAVVIVMGGKQRGGMSVTHDVSTLWDVAIAAGNMRKLVEVLRSIADTVERDNQAAAAFPTL